MKLVEKLQPFHIRTNEQSSLTEYCYDLWRKTWSQTFDDLRVGKKICSDDFLDRDLYGLKTIDNEICGFMLVRSFIAMPYSLEHSYFDNYPEDLKRTISQYHEKIIVISYMTISPEWRKLNTNIPISEILMGLCVLHFINSDAKKLWGYFRNNRKTQDIFYRHGGIQILKDHKAYNVLVDISYIDKKSAKLSDFLECKIETLKFWNQLKKGEPNAIGAEEKQIISTFEQTI